MKWGEVRWRRLYIREEGSFALLPLYVRALAGELLKFVDDEGRLYVGDREPWEVIARLAGAEVGERRMLRTHIPALIADGYLVRDGAYLVVKNFGVAQGRERRTTHARTENESSASGARPVHESSASEERTENESCTSSELSTRNDSGLGLMRAPASERSEEIREEEIRERDPAIAVPEPSGSVDRPVGQPREPQPGEPRALAARAAPSAPSSSVGQQPLLTLEPSTRAPPRAAEDVFAAYMPGWHRVVGGTRAPVLDAKRRKLIAARLKEFDLDYLLAAARGIWASTWHINEKQTTFDLVFRDAAHVEKFAALDPSATPKRGEGPIYEEDDLSDAPPMRPSVLACSRSSDKTLSELIANWGRTSASVGMGTGTEN